MTSISLVPTFEQVPYNSLIARIDNGGQGLFELTNLFNERKELEEKNVLHSAKNYHLFLSKVQVKHHKGLGEIIIKDLDDLKISRAATVNRHKIAVQNCLREVAHAEEALDKAKKNFLKAKSDLERGKNKLVVCEAAVVEAQRVSDEKKARESGGRDSSKFSMGRMLSAFENTPEQERDKQQRKVDRRNNEVALCLSQIVEKKAMLMDRISVMDTALQKAGVAFQEAEFERISKLKICMKNFCELERAAINARSELLTVLEDAINSQNVEDDLSLFISQEKNVELTHKYTNAINLMDLHFKKSEAEHERNRINEGEGGGLGRSFDAAETNTTLPPPPTSPTTASAAERRAASAAAAAAATAASAAAANAPPNLDHRDAEVGDRRPPMLEYDDNAPDNSTSIASQGDLNKIERMSVALSALFPHPSPSTAASPNSSTGGSGSNGNNSPSPTAGVNGSGNSNNSSNSAKSQWEEGDWRELIFFKETRELFLQELDEQRGRRSLLTREGFASMCNAMKVLLDYCETFDDAKAAMRVVNMANTFHTINETADETPSPPAPVESSESTSESETITNSDNNTTEEGAAASPVPLAAIASPPPAAAKSTSRGGGPKKHYLQAEPKLNRHTLWRKQGFWELALQEGTLALMALNEPSLWDELNPEGLREAVIGVHNIVFGQLGSLAFAMHELGLLAEEVEKNIFLMSRRAQLTEDQELELIKNVRIMYGIYVPPPLPPIVAPQAQQQQQQQQVPSQPSSGTNSESSVPTSPPIVVVGKVIATPADGATATAGHHHANRPVVHAHSVVASSGNGTAVIPPPLPSVGEDGAVRRSSVPPKGEAILASHHQDTQGPPPLPTTQSTVKPSTTGAVPPPILKGTAVAPIPPAAAEPQESSFFSLFGRGTSANATSTLKAGAVKGTKSAPASAQKNAKGGGGGRGGEDNDDFFATL